MSHKHSHNTEKEHIKKQETDAAAETAKSACDEAVAPPAEPATEELIQKLTEEKDKYYNNWVRSVADLENCKKQAQKEKEDFRKFALENIIREILIPIDYLEMAISHAKTAHNVEALIQGVEYTHKGMIDVLKNYGIEAIDGEGKEFDPTVFEAHDQVETDEVKEGTIMKQHRKAYTIHGRLLRAGIVSVAKKPGEKTEEQTDKDSEIKEE